MTELIPIADDNSGNKAVSARALYDFLEVKTDFSNWCKRMFEYGFEEHKDFTPILAKSIGGRPGIDYALTLDTAKEISMLQRSDKGKQARQYFIDCEKQANRPMTPAEMFMAQATLNVSLERRAAAIEQKQQALETEVQLLKDKSKTRPDYFTVVAYASIKGKSVNLKLAGTLGRKASTLCKRHNLEKDSVYDVRYGRVNAYPAHILEQVFKEQFKS